MNYYKNTLSPIADAARFFKEKQVISYEDKFALAIKRNQLNVRSQSAEKAGEAPKNKMLSMEYI